MVLPVFETDVLQLRPRKAGSASTGAGASEHEQQNGQGADIGGRSWLHVATVLVLLEIGRISAFRRSGRVVGVSGVFVCTFIVVACDRGPLFHA